MAGLVQYTGSIAIGGRAVDGVPAHKREVGLMFQDDLLFPHLDVAANVGFGSGGRRVEEMLELVGLPGFASRRVETLSGGQAQRVALARALAANPRVLLLDEPFGALDAVLKAALTLDVRAVLKGSTVLTVTHDRAEAFTMGDRIAILRQGRLVQVGTPDELWRNPADDYVARLVGLSVIDGQAFAPGDLVVDAEGPWEVIVTGRTFRAGEYVVTGVRDDTTITFLSPDAPAIGERLRLRATPAS